MKKLDLSQIDFDLRGFNMLQEINAWATTHYASMFDGLSMIQISALYFLTLKNGFDTYMQWLNTNSAQAEATYKTIKNADSEALLLIIRESTKNKDYVSFLASN